METTRTRRSLVLLVALGALIAGGLWWSALDVREAPAATSAEAADFEVERIEVAPSTFVLDFEAPAQSESDRDVGSRRDAIATSDSTLPRVTLFVEVWKYLDVVQSAELQVVALSHEVQEPPTATAATNVTRDLSVARRYENAVVGRTDARGRVELDVTELLATPSGWKPHALAIRVASAGEQVDEFDLLLSSADRARALLEPLRCEARLDLVCNSTVHATVRTVDDEFAPTAIHYFKIVGRASEKASATSERTDEGTLRLVRSFECGREYVAVASCDGYATQSVWFRAASNVYLGEIVLERGAVLAGRVRVGLHGVRGLVQAELVNEGDGWPFGVEGTTYLWRGGGLVLMRASASSDDDGAFRIEGLAPERYRLTLSSAQMGLPTPIAIGEASAPAAGLELHLNSATIQLLVTRAGRPLPRVNIAVFQRGPSGNAGWVIVTDDEGRARLWVHGDHSTRVAIDWRETPQSAPLRREVPLDFPGAGERREVRIDL